MASKKDFNSKNLSNQMQTLINLGKGDLVMEILKAKELQSLLPNILNSLKRKRQIKSDYYQTKIFSKTDLDKDILKKLEDTLKIDITSAEKSAKIIIDENMSAGVKLKSGDMLIDATLETMLQKAIENL